MIKDLESAIEKVRKLPEERQRYVARMIEELARDAPTYQLNEHERELVQEGLDAADTDRVVSDADMEAFWNRHRT